MEEAAEADSGDRQDLGELAGLKGAEKNEGLKLKHSNSLPQKFAFTVP